MMLSFELKKKEFGKLDEVEVYLDRNGLELLFAQLGFLKDQKTDHVHLMAKSWGGSELSDEPQCSENTVIHHVKILLR